MIKGRAQNMFLSVQTLAGMKNGLASQSITHCAAGQPPHISASASFFFEAEGCQQVGGSLLDRVVYEFIRTLKARRAKLTSYRVIISMEIKQGNYGWCLPLPQRPSLCLLHFSSRLQGCYENG